MQISRRDDGAGLCIQLVKIVLRRRDIYVLNTIIARIYERRRKYLLHRKPVKVSWECSHKDLTKGRTSHYVRVQVVITVDFVRQKERSIWRIYILLITRTAIVAAPCEKIGVVSLSMCPW